MNYSLSVIQNLSRTELFLLTAFSIFRQKKMQRTGFLFLIPFVLASLFYLLNGITLDFQVLRLIFLPAAFFALIAALLLIASLVMPRFTREAEYSFQAGGLSCIRNGKEYKMGWDKVIELKETKSYFFLFITPSAPHVIQKSNFPTEESIDQFRAFLNTRLAHLTA